MQKKLNIQPLSILQRVAEHTLMLLLLAAPAALLVSCDASQDNESKAPAYTFTVPVTLALDNQVVFTNDSTMNNAKAATRATTVGDPGLDDELKAPTHLYLWALAELNTAKTVDGVTCKYELMYRHFIVDDANYPVEWEYVIGATDSENKDSRYTTTMITFSTDLLANNASVGRVYAVASEKALDIPTASILYVNTNESEGQYTKYVSDYDATKTSLEAATLNLSSWTSADLRDLYSSPVVATTATDGVEVNNGNVSFQNSNISVTRLKLYHCAAKADFTWEVDSVLQKTTSVSTITVNNLPTECKLFKPTDNPTGSGYCLVLGSATGAVNTLNPGNQWIGRAYAYVLQQPTAKLEATTVFAGTAGRGNGSTDFTPTTPDAIFTGWYRINATIK